MTFQEYATEIKTKILNQMPFKKLYGEKTASVYLEFYEGGDRSITYKMDAYDWEQVKEFINQEGKLIQ